MAQEKIFETKVKDFLRAEGAWFVKFFANAYTQKGVPDVLACINGHFVGIEVKAQNGTPSELQRHHIKKIREAGGFAFILYPSGFDEFKRFVYDLKRERFSRDMKEVLK